ncbi:MAG: peptide chain release factor N(5)-glutamine methyltransferase [Dokdonella sp.]|nr:peptide chain release factor N(5)-glutamine methyltransferase [Dokdonella sp.]
MKEREPHTIRALIDAANARLAGVERRSEAEILLAHVLGRSRSWLFAWPELEPTTEQRAAFARLIEARRHGEPIAYLTGRRGFWTLELEVTPAVLIPRPETELLVELALARLPLDGEVSVADLGTGSGAIALAIASERPQARVLATDASEAALAVARGNAQRLGLGKVDFAQGNWCAPLGERRFDLMVSNPPYIASGDPHLAQGDLRFEPGSALASGADGLDAIRCILAEAPRHLVGRGWLLLEHGHDQAAAVRELLTAHAFVEVGSTRDAAGHERVSFGRRPPVKV